MFWWCDGGGVFGVEGSCCWWIAVVKCVRCVFVRVVAVAREQIMAVMMIMMMLALRVTCDV